MTGDVYTADEVTDTLGVGIFQVKLIFICGAVWMARGFEYILLRSISKFQSCTWNLERWQGALMLTLSELLTVVGCFLFGMWSDNFGRRTALYASLIFLFVFTCISAGLPNYIWFVIFRAVVAFCIGGISQSVVLCCEYMPNSQRGRAVYILSLFWALGVIIMTTVLYLTLNHRGNWRTYVAIASFPAFAAMLMMRFFPESFRYLMVTNHYFAANKIITEMAESNQIELFGHLQVVRKQRRRGRLVDLFRYSYARSTVLFWFLALATSISSLGLNLTTPNLFRNSEETVLENPPSVNFLGNITGPVNCMKKMTTNAFIYVIWTNALEYPGFVLYFILVDILDRRKLLFTSYLLSCLFLIAVLIPYNNHYSEAGLLFTVRTLLMSQTDLLFLTTAETYPTVIRGTGVGSAVGMFYVGKFLNSYIEEGIEMVHELAPFVLYAVILLACAIASLFLKHEPRGKELQDIIQN